MRAFREVGSRLRFAVATFAVVSCLIGEQEASAQLAFVPRQVTVVAGPGANFGGADTAFSAGMRGLGQFYEGQGQYLTGASHYLQALGQNQRDFQAASAMATQNYYQRISLKREWNQQLERDKQASMAASRARNESKRFVSVPPQSLLTKDQPQLAQRDKVEDPIVASNRSDEAYRKWLPSPLRRTFTE